MSIFNTQTNYDYFALVLLSVILLALYWHKIKLRALPLPPGPPKLPIVGNILQLRSAELPDYQLYSEWSKRYGSDILHVDLAGVSLVVINSADVATELLEKKSRIYSSRPPAPMVYDLMGWDWNFGFKPYGEEWRERRRTFLQIFNSRAAKQFYPQELKATRRLLRALLDQPEDFVPHLQHHAGSVVLSVAYGLDIKTKGDPYVAIADEAMHPLVEALVPGMYLVDSFPILKYVPAWFPGAGFQRKAQVSKALAMKMVNKPFDDGKALMEKHGVPSFIASALQNITDEQNTAQRVQVIRDAAASMYLAGSDTTVSAISGFILAMLFAPETQIKAQAELDRVVPSGRLPDFTDKEALPYVTALVKESFRWQNVTPLAVPHYLEVEDQYNGYRIPANSIVVGNVWAILHDKNLYPEPFKFEPGRYLVDGKLSFENARDPMFAAFGFGRRVCPGRYMAESSVWLGMLRTIHFSSTLDSSRARFLEAIASILKIFNISKATDENGETIEPSYEYRNGVVAEPLPFKCSIKPRSKEAEDLVRLVHD